MQALLRIQEVLRRRGVSKSQHYEDVQNGKMIQPIKPTPHVSLWPESEITTLIEAQIAGLREDEIKALVRRLMEKRKEKYGEFTSMIHPGADGPKAA